MYATEAQEPKNVQEALSSSEKKHWKAAMQSEMEFMKSNDVWDLVKLPEDRKLVGCRWVQFKRKMDAYDRIERYKERLVAQGFSQRKGINIINNVVACRITTQRHANAYMCRVLKQIQISSNDPLNKSTL